ncbi:MAG: hypothetical protein D6725_00035 [Planctomycetota bacterium]|nr:MAG: hypothetical protein D6725_00035 [Planctomycetota bacterium]
MRGVPAAESFLRVLVALQPRGEGCAGRFAKRRRGRACSVRCDAAVDVRETAVKRVAMMARRKSATVWAVLSGVVLAGLVMTGRPAAVVRADDTPIVGAADADGGDSGGVPKPSRNDTAGNPTDGESAGEASGAAASGDGRDQPKTTLEQLLFVPYSKLSAVLDRAGSVIFVPYAEYLRLWGEALRSKEGGGPPVAAVIRSVTYAARAERDRVLIDATMEIRALKESWAELPIAFAGLAVASVSSEPAGVVLRGTSEGGYRLLLPKAGTYRTSIRLEGRVRTSPDGKEVAFQCPPVAVTRLTVDVDEPEQSIQVDPAVTVEARSAADGHTAVRAALPSTGRIVVRWHPRVSRKPQMELLTTVRNLAQVRIQDGLVHTDAWLRFKVLRGELREIRIGVARGQNILDVGSPDAQVQGWTVDDSGPFQVVTVKLLAPVTTEATVEVHTERTQPTGPFAVAGRADGNVLGIHALDANREAGQIVISAARELTVAVEEQTGIARIDPSEVDASIRRGDGLAFKYFNPRFALRIAVRPIEPRIEAVHKARFVFGDEELRLEADLSLTIERTGVFEVRFRVPESLSVQTVAGPAVKEHRFDPQTRVVTVTLKQKTLGTVELRVRGVRPLPANQSSASLVLPMLELLGVDRETGHIHVYAPEALEVITDAAEVTGAQPEPPTQAVSIPRVRLVSAWSFNRPPVRLPVTTRRRPTHLTATVATVISVRPERTQVLTRLTYHVQYAGLDTFRLLVPAAAGDEVQIELAGGGDRPAIRQRVRVGAVEGGYVEWRVVLQREVTGDVPLRVVYYLDSKLSDEGNGPAAAAAEGRKGGPVAEAAADGDETAAGGTEATGDASTEGPPHRPAPTTQLVVPLVQAAGLQADRKAGTPQVALADVRGEVVIDKHESLSVSAMALDEALEPIDVRELTLVPPQGTLAFRYFRQPVSVQIAARRFEVQSVVETVVLRGLVEVVVARDATATYRCRYRIKSSERQRLPVELPAGSELLAVVVNGRSVNPERPASAEAADGALPFLVNVARNTPPDVPLTLILQFRRRLGDVFSFRGGTLSLPLPVIGGRDAGVVVQEQMAAVWMPSVYTLLGRPDHFERADVPLLWRWLWVLPAAPIDLEKYIGVDAAAALAFPTEGRLFVYRALGFADRLQVTWWSLWFYGWVLGGAAVLVGLVLVRTSWENKLGVLLFGALIASLFSLRYGDWVSEAVFAARFGLLAMVGLWILHAVFRPGSQGPASPTAAAPEEPPPSDQGDAPSALGQTPECATHAEADEATASVSGTAPPSHPPAEEQTGAAGSATAQRLPETAQSGSREEGPEASMLGPSSEALGTDRAEDIGGPPDEAADAGRASETAEPTEGDDASAGGAAGDEPRQDDDHGTGESGDERNDSA